MLNDRQKRFIAEYIVDLNATRAAIRAGYSAKTADRIGSRLLGKVEIAAAVAKAQERCAAKLEITAERVLAEIACVAFSDITDYIREDGTIDWTLIKGLPREKRVAVQKLIVDTTGGAGDGERKKIERTRFELASKLEALEMLGRNLKLFTDKIEVDDMRSLTDEQLRARLVPLTKNDSLSVN